MTDSPNYWNTRATDEKGHKVNPRLSLPPYVFAKLEGLASSDKFSEYRTWQDVARHSIYRHLEWLTENDYEDCSGIISAWQADLLIEKEIERYKLGKKMIADVSYLRMNAQTDEDKNAIKEIVTRALTADIPETTRLELLRVVDRDIL